MDPTANLKEQIELARTLIAAAEAGQEDPPMPYDMVDVLRLAELVVALDGWLATGGFPPNQWNYVANTSLVRSK